jgi:hypothetical protein
MGGSVYSWRTWELGVEGAEDVSTEPTGLWLSIQAVGKGRGRWPDPALQEPL